MPKRVRQVYVGYITIRLKILRAGRNLTPLIGWISWVSSWFGSAHPPRKLLGLHRGDGLQAHPSANLAGSSQLPTASVWRETGLSFCCVLFVCWQDINIEQVQDLLLLVLGCSKCFCCRGSNSSTMAFLFSPWLYEVAEKVGGCL